MIGTFAAVISTALGTMSSTRKTPGHLRFALVANATGSRTPVDTSFYGKGSARFYAHIADPELAPLRPQIGDRLVSVSGNAFVVIGVEPGLAPHEAHVLLASGAPERVRFVPTVVPAAAPAFPQEAARRSRSAAR